MRIHTDVLTTDDLYRAMRETGLAADGVSIDFATVHGSRRRARGIEFRLEATEMVGRRRPRNTGTHGAEDGFTPWTRSVYAATYDEHGVWMARLFEIDPNAVIGYYDGAEDFHRQTDDRYRRQLAPTL